MEQELGREVLAISAVTGQGLAKLVGAVARATRSRRGRDVTTTYLACLTPPGTAALATLALSGPEDWRLTRETFCPAGSSPLPDDPEPGRFWFGKLGEAGIGDDVVLAEPF